MNFLTTLLDLCVDDKTAQTAPKHEKGHTASQTTCFTKSCHHGSRTKADQQRHEDKNTNRQIITLVLKETRKNKTWEASTLTGVLQEQTRRDKNNLSVSSTCCRLNTDDRKCGMNSGRIFTPTTSPSPSQVMSPTTWSSASSATPRVPSPASHRHRTWTLTTLHSASCSPKHTENTPITAVRKVCLSVSR